ncbi:MAG: hypothetical protein GXP62_08990 [Oligoflexia bacterium]|nr:hypothetical protein [Oligoflexia bacterium]
MSELVATATSLLRSAREAGAVDVEVMAESVIQRSFRDGADGRSRGRPRSWTSLSLRVRDARGALGAVTARSPSSTALVALVANAMQRAALAEPDPTTAPVGRLDIADRGLGILDQRLKGIGDADRAEVAHQNVEGVRGGADGIRPVSFAYLEEQRERVVQTTAGVSAAVASTRFSLDGSVVDESTGEVLSDSVQSRHFADVASVPLGVDMARRLASFRIRAERPSGDCALLLDPIAVARLLPALVPAFQARLIESGRSFLSGLMGQRVAAPRLHIIDDPGLSGALATRAFDDRGVPPVAIPLLREGIAGGMYLGPELAAARGLRPTGHAHADGSLWTGNLVVRPGSRSRNMLLPDQGRHVAVEDILDLSGVDLRAGTLDLPVRALCMDGPKVLGCAGTARLRCSIQELLTSVVDICSDQSRFRDVDACTWIIYGVQLSDA